MSRTRMMLITMGLLVPGCGRPPKHPPTLPPIAQASAPEQQPLPSCVRSWPEARNGTYGYDHIVHLESSCRMPSACRVSTDLTPTAVVVSVAPGEHVEVVTLRGSPAADFRPIVECSPVAR